MRTITVGLTGAAGIYGGLVLYRYVYFSNSLLSFNNFLLIIREYFVKAQYTGNEQLFGKTAIVTGANTGIGKEVAHDLARRGRKNIKNNFNVSFYSGARVIMACRDMKKCEETREKIVADSFNTNVICRECDLASIESIKKFAEEINKNENYIHLLINNAGIMWHPLKLTKDGFEQHLGVNYLGVSRIKLKILKFESSF
jgi:NADP-dependent 3-hydroxy acid dehydrogenase YdfG